MMTILIFGAAIRPDGQPSTALRRRVEAALATADGRQDVLFLPTGAVGRHGPSEASVMARLLRESGIPDTRIRLEETGHDTLSSARALVRLLRERDSPGPVVVATSGYHLPRCLLLLWLFGIAAQPCRLRRTPPANSRLKRWYWRLREIPAIPYDAVLAVWERITGRL